MALILAMIGQADHQLAAQGSNTAAAPSRSTTIALTSDEQRLIVVNREANSVSIIRVKDSDGNDVTNKIAEVVVGEEPRCVAVSPDDRLAYVTNGISGDCHCSFRRRHIQGYLEIARPLSAADIDVAVNADCVFAIRRYRGKTSDVNSKQGQVNGMRIPTIVSTAAFVGLAFCVVCVAQSQSPKGPTPSVPAGEEGTEPGRK